jgi:hypothetical protein
MTDEAKAEGTLYVVESKANGAMPRLIKAPSKAAVRAHIFAEQHAEPRPAKIADVERAVNAGAKIEQT